MGGVAVWEESGCGGIGGVGEWRQGGVAAWGSGNVREWRCGGVGVVMIVLDVVVVVVVSKWPQN